MALHDANNEELIKKNKKRKPLGTIHLTIQMNPMTKEEMNEVSKRGLEVFFRVGAGVLDF